MWTLGLGGGGGGGVSVGGAGGGESSYPERPGEANCIYYMKTGFCGYGERCRFNHPRDRGEVSVSLSEFYISCYLSPPLFLLFFGVRVWLLLSLEIVIFLVEFMTSKP